MLVREKKEYVISLPLELLNIEFSLKFQNSTRKISIRKHRGQARVIKVMVSFPVILGIILGDDILGSEFREHIEKENTFRNFIRKCDMIYF